MSRLMWDGYRRVPMSSERCSRARFLSLCDPEKFNPIIPELKRILRELFVKHPPTYIYKSDASFNYGSLTFHHIGYTAGQPDGAESLFLFESDRSIRQVTHIEELNLRKRELAILDEALSRNAVLLKEAKENGELSDVGALYCESERIREAQEAIRAKPNPIREHIDSVKVKFGRGWNIVGGLLVIIDV